MAWTMPCWCLASSRAPGTTCRRKEPSVRIRIHAVTVAGVIAMTVNGRANAQTPVDTRPPNGTGQTPAFAGQADAPERKSHGAFDVITGAEGVQHPWGLACLPNGKMLVTERPGRLRVVTADGKLSEPVARLPAVDARGQGGLLDVAIDPSFASNNYIYWSYSEPGDGMNNTAV